MAPVLAEATIDGKPRTLVLSGSKTALAYILDRADGTPAIGIEERPVPQEPLQKTWPTQPYPLGDSIVPICADHNATGALRVPPHYPVGCLFTPHTDRPVVVSPGIGGGPDWSAQSFNPRTGLLYIGAGLVNAYHSIPTGGVGSRPPGQERSGRLVAKDITTNRIRWSRDMPWSIAHGNGILSTAGDLLFLGQPDGYLLGLDIRDGSERWRFQAGAGVHTTPITYLAGGVQHIAVFAGGNGLPYNSPRGDFLWGFTLGGEVKPAPAPPPPPMRQPVQAADAPVDGQSANFTVTLGRQWNAAKQAPDAVESSAQNAMAPTILTVPVGATVTFVNPATNRAEHCATQFFEGLFSIGPLKPGDQAQVHVHTRGRVLLQRLHQPADDGEDRGAVRPGPLRPARCGAPPRPAADRPAGRRSAGRP